MLVFSWFAGSGRLSHRLQQFRHYNDRYGFSRGDEIICTLAPKMSIARTESNERGFVRHIGGDDLSS
jgi:GGDEF domain-containing protein